MPDASTPAPIALVGTIFVPVRDQDRALAFYTGALGLVKRSDFVYAGGERWVEVAPPGAASGIALIVPPAGFTGGIQTRIALGARDVHALHADLLAQGADVDAHVMADGDPVVQWGGVALAGAQPMFLLRDPDGNSLLVTPSP